LDGQTIIVHRLIMRVIRDGLVQPGRRLHTWHAREGACRFTGPLGRQGYPRAGDGAAGKRDRPRM
jgi:hypothetical protein